MTDKMKCPFCGAELEECFSNSDDLACSSMDCIYVSLPLPPEIWRALIDGKKAQDALRDIEKRIDARSHNEQVEDSDSCLFQIKLRKALDVAIDVLKKATDYLGNQNPLYEVEGMNLYIDLSNGLEKINKIMNGGK